MGPRLFPNLVEPVVFHFRVSRGKCPDYTASATPKRPLYTGCSVTAQTSSAIHTVTSMSPNEATKETRAAMTK